MDRYVLDGRVVTMDDRFTVHSSGRVYVDGSTVAAVAEAAAPPPDGFAGAPLIRTGDTIYPGLIELHNHLSYNALPLWQVPQPFDNRAQWMKDRGYRRFVSGPAAVLGRTSGLLESVVRYVEAKCLLGGVTTSQGIALASNMGIRRFYQGLVRNVEDTGDDALPAAGTRVDDVDAVDARAFLDRLNRSSSLLLHLAEGVDGEAREHFRSLRIGPDEWAITPALAGIHCAGLAGRDYQIFRARGGSMVWSPLSNLLLYGGTADIARARTEGLPVALGSDWSPSGSKNLLAELKVAWLVSERRGGVFTPRELVAMATVNPARILKWDAAVGSLEPGKRADLIVVDGRGGDPYEHLLKARESAVTLAVIDGLPRYGDPKLMDRFGPGGSLVERRTVGGAARVLDLTEAGADPLIGTLSLAEAEARLAGALADLPELAHRLEDPITASVALGATDGTTPGSWFLELDHEELGLGPDRHALGGLALGNGDDATVGSWWGAALVQPLSEVLQPLDLDPITVVDDERYIDRLAAVTHLGDEANEVVRGLAGLYGRKLPGGRARARRAPAAASFAAPVPLADAASGAVQPGRLADFLAAVGDGTLTLADRRLLVSEALLMLEQCYVHLVLKQAMHAVDPIQRLRLLRDRLALLTEETRGPEVEFHRELTEIFISLRDLHTNYLLPAPFSNRTAFLPFLVERCFDGADERYLVSKMTPGLAHADFVPGVEVTHWNGAPIRRAVEANARRHAGSNPDAGFARGLNALTIRPLLRMLPPDEDWVVVTYRGLDGIVRQAQFDWQVAVAGAPGVTPTSLAARAAQGADLEVEATNAAKLMFAPRAEAAAAAIADPTSRVTRVAVSALDEPTSMPKVFRARRVATPSGTFGHIRIFTFSVDDDAPFVDEFVRLAAALPQNGLIVDVRGNGGGLIHAAERLLQVLTPHHIEPEPAQMTTSPLMLDLCGRHAPSPLDPTFDLGPWIDSLALATATGAQYSNGFTITEERSANRRGQRYHGPVVLVTDALCYSATDIFSAGFQDHAIGPVLGVDGHTGAGGANVWTHELLQLLMDTAPDGGPPANPFVDLPAGSGFRVSVRRTLRVGADRAGTPVEDLGVVPDVRHHFTARDLMEDNFDLLAHAGELLVARPSYTLGVEADTRPDGRVRLRLTTNGLDRVDVACDERPVASLNVEDGPSTHLVRPAGGPAREVELTGWAGSTVVANRRAPVV